MNLVFKGGTCLNKIYYPNYRLSEDLDFSMVLSSEKLTRTQRRKSIKPVKQSILPYVNSFNMRIDNIDKAGNNESTQYIYYISYDSAVLDKPQSIKLEVGLRYNPILPVSTSQIRHIFLHPFTQEPLFEVGRVNCLSLKELVAEKMRATATRLSIAPRDFYDLDFIIRSGFNFQDYELWDLFKKKLSEDGFEPDLIKYRISLGRSTREISEMAARIDAELLAVLTPQEQKAFDLDKTLQLINDTLKTMV